MVKSLFLGICILLSALHLSYGQSEGVINDTVYIYRSVSEALQNPERVFRLYLVKQKLDSIPASVFQFRNLRELNLSKNKIQEVPPEVAALTNLEKLDLSNNELVHLPMEIGSLSRLIHLNLNRNVIEDLPPTIGQLENLEILEMWDNELRDVPDEIEQLKNLRLFELRGILFTEEQQRRIDSLVVKSAKLQLSPACQCKY